MRKFLFLVLALVGHHAFGQTSFEVDGLTYQTTGSDRVSVVKAGAEVKGEVAIPSQVSYDGKAYSVTSIGEEAFKWSGVTFVTLPETVDSIYNGAFSGSDLTGAVLNQGLLYIGQYAFSSCAIDSIDIPSSVEVIDSQAFFGSSLKKALSKVTLHDGLRVIGSGAFYKAQITEIDIPATVDSIGSTAFLNCANLKSVRLHDGLRVLGNGVFNQCSSLTDIVLPSTIETVGIELFMNAKALSHINIPASLKNIGESMIAGTNVSIIELDDANPYFIKYNDVVYTKDFTLVKMAPVKGLVSHRVKEGTLGIDGGAFMGSDIASITLPEGLVAISDYAFCQSQLAEINFPSSLVFLGEQAFAATQFKELTLPENVPFINDGELAGCNQLKKVVIPSGVSEVYPHAFSSCGQLDSIVALGSVPPVIMDYYEEYDHPLYGVSSAAVMMVPKGSGAAYKAEGWDLLTIAESSIEPLRVVRTAPADSAQVEGYQSLSFEITFDQDITLMESTPKVYVRKGYAYSASTIKPSSGEWTAVVSGNTLTVFGTDYDGFTDVFKVEEGEQYFVTIPAGTVKAANGAQNEQVRIWLVGKKQSTSIANKAQRKDKASITGRYNISGQKITSPQRGLNIVRMSDRRMQKRMER